MIIEDATLDELCVLIKERHGYDFTEYQREPLRRSLSQLLKRRSLDGTASLHDLASDPKAFLALLADLTVTTSSMFRTPRVFKALARDVFPYLKTYRRIKIWHAGCARGEEAYSLAILLKEHGLLSRSTIYATDINPVVLAAAKEGIYPVRRIKEFTENYLEAGGSSHLSVYFEMGYGHAKFSHELRSRILFSKHDLVADASFGEMQLILCRNVLIYFNPPLQGRVLDLFLESLCPGGFLSLGPSEAGAVRLISRGALEPFLKREQIYRSIHVEKD